jgi:hypothetical protein
MQRHPVGHPRVPVIVAAVILAVAVAYAVAGHPIALVWGSGIAAFWLAPDAIGWWEKRPASPLLVSLALFVAGLAMAATWPLAWQYPDSINYRFSDTPFKHNTFEQFVAGLVSCLGILVVLTVPVQHLINIRNRRRHKNDDSAERSRRPGRRAPETVRSMNRRRSTEDARELLRLDD